MTFHAQIFWIYSNFHTDIHTTEIAICDLSGIFHQFWSQYGKNGIVHKNFNFLTWSIKKVYGCPWFMIGLRLMWTADLLRFHKYFILCFFSIGNKIVNFIIFIKGIGELAHRSFCISYRVGGSCLWH